METGSIILLVTEVVTLVGVIMAVVAASQARREGRETKKHVQKIHLEINSRMTAYMELLEKSSLAEGRKAERDNPEP